jgi:translation initiation factor 2 gamma subunit (eIF-2gamma)
MTIIILNQTPLIDTTTYVNQQCQIPEITKGNMSENAVWLSISAFHWSPLCKPMVMVISIPMI